MKKNVFLALAVIGLLVPYYFLFQFLRANGFAVALLVPQVFANSASTAFTMDLMISIVAFWIYMFAETNKLRMRNSWVYLLASLLIGLSFALPLFLYFRERKLETR
jgi:hypothetical protein